jgi:hypothetical protein
MNEIAKAAWDAPLKRFGIPTEPFLCLRLARIIVERAYYKGKEVFYTKYAVARTTQERPVDKNGREDWSWFASDIEASAKELKLGVKYKDRQPGDLVFNWNAAKPYGHVAVLIDTNTVIENVNPSYRKNSTVVAPYTCLTRLDDLGYTLIARFPKL